MKLSRAPIVASSAIMCSLLLVGCGSASDGSHASDGEGGASLGGNSAKGGSVGRSTGGSRSTAGSSGSSASAGRSSTVSLDAGASSVGGSNNASAGQGTNGGASGAAGSTSAIAGAAGTTRGADAAGATSLGGAAGSAGLANAGTAGTAGTPVALGGYCQACAQPSDCAGANAACGEVAGHKVCLPNCDTSACAEAGQECKLWTDGHQYCMPASKDCACTAATAGSTQACTVKNTFGTCTGTAMCSPVLGFVGCNARTPAAEFCNAVDDDCDGSVDEDFAALGSACDGTDSDSCANGTTVCAASGLGVTCSTESKSDIVEICDGIDNDCDGATDEGCDADGDGYCNASMTIVGTPTVCSKGGGDCNDGAATVNPGVEELCDGIDNNCSGSVDEVTVRPPNDNQLGKCANTKKVCVAAKWENDYTGVAGYGQAETPDASFADENCDGIDGTASTGVFVSNDLGTDTGSCSKTFPCKSIGYAEQVAVRETRPQIYVAAGTYAGVVELVGGVQIYGGYDAAWVRGPYTTAANAVILIGGVRESEHMVLYGSGITTSVKVADLIIEAPTVTDTDANGNGRSSYGAYIVDSKVTFERVKLVGGKGANGRTGAVGVGATNPAPSGGNGGNGSEFSVGCDNSTRGTAGVGASNPNCNTQKSKGGNGGVGGTMDTSCAWYGCDNCNATAGLPGETLPSGTDSSGTLWQGAVGGAGGPVGEGAGANGQPGGAGTHGVNGAGGARNVNARGQMVGNFWYSFYGNPGGLGTEGGGGSGGGGGGGSDDGVDANGGGGGGGGAGGCAATVAGQGGGGAGSSFGLFALRSTLVVTGCELLIGAGGNGGPGGAGATGQTGGGAGWFGAGSNSGAGGLGGTGGDGGHSGGGAGGHGGLAYGIFLFESTTSTASSTFTPGTAGLAGPGGSSPGHAGTNGLSGTNGEVFDCATEPECKTAI